MSQIRAVKPCGGTNRHMRTCICHKLDGVIVVMTACARVWTMAVDASVLAVMWSVADFTRVVATAVVVNCATSVSADCVSWMVEIVRC